MTTFEVRGNPNYAAQVIEVKTLVDLPGLDNLVGLPWAGLLALVPKTTQIGDTLIVFPAEAQLSHEFALANDLYRHSELNHTEGAVGYLEDNRRVRAIRMRGNLSSALALSLDSLAPFTSELPTVGTSFDTVNGREVSRKYELPVKGGNTGESQQEKAWKRVDAKFLPEHIDTAQYLREADSIPDDTFFTVTQKIHGCFRSSTRVSMWDGTKKKITDIRAGDVVVGYVGDEAVPSVVTRDAFSTGRTETWTKLKFKQPIKGDNPTTFSTPEHQFLTNRGWISAVNVVPGDVAYFVRHQPEITDDKRSVLVGLMLGDGSISGVKRNSVEWSHKKEHIEYLEYVRRLLGNLTGTGDIQWRTSGYGTQMAGARTKALESVRQFTQEWEYGVPYDLELTDLSLAVWYLDDGSLSHTELQQDRATFAICAYDEDNAKKIQNAMIVAGFDNPVLFNSSGYWRIRLNKDDAETLFRRIRSFVPPVMQYKLPTYHRGYFREPKVVDRESPVVFNTRVLSNKTVTAREIQYAVKWDISTETENFVANGIVVHNSSVRIANTIVKRKPKWWERGFLKRPDTEYAHVYGSRKVIKDPNNPNQDHYYNYDLWSTEGTKYDDLIPRGVVVYGELVGFTKDGGAIQKDYTYEAKPGEADLYIYRVAVVSPDGLLFDLSWEGVKAFCAERGLNHVAELWSGFKRDFVPEMWLDRRFWDEGYTNAVQLSHPSLPDEGVILRAEGVLPRVWKLKGPKFFAHETAMLDEEAVDLEAQG